MCVQAILQFLRDSQSEELKLNMKPEFKASTQVTVGLVFPGRVLWGDQLHHRVCNKSLQTHGEISSLTVGRA